MEEIKYRAFKYIRLSSADEKPGESDSIANQRRLLDEFLKKHPEIEDVGEKIDDGYSGIIFDRPAFNEMMDEIKAGKANCCITKDLSRFGREYIETGRYLRNIFPALGVRFIAINDNIDTLTNSGDDLPVAFKSMMNDSYCRDISIKTRSALEAKRRNGEYVGAFPVYGYKKSEDNHNLLVVDEYAASIVREIFKMKIDGYSTAAIANALNERGVLSPVQYKKERGLQCARKGYCDRDNTKWSVSTILRLLRDETYTGTLIQGITSTPNYKLKQIIEKPVDEWTRVENTHEAIIHKYHFDNLQRVLQLDTRTAPYTDKVHIFSGILICGSCGARMTRKTIMRNDFKCDYCWCPTTKKRGCKEPALIKEDELSRLVLICLKAYIKNVLSLGAMLEEVEPDKVARGHADMLIAKVRENESEIEKLNEARETLSENLLKGILMKNEYKSIKTQLTEDMDQLIASNKKLKKDIDDALSCTQERLAWIEHFKQYSDIEELDRSTVISLIYYIKIFKKDEINIFFNFQPEFETACALLERSVLQ